jgi:hypothetical protein
VPWAETEECAYCMHTGTEIVISWCFFFEYRFCFNPSRTVRWTKEWSEIAIQNAFSSRTSAVTFQCACWSYAWYCSKASSEHRPMYVVVIQYRDKEFQSRT